MGLVEEEGGTYEAGGKIGYYWLENWVGCCDEWVGLKERVGGGCGRNGWGIILFWLTKTIINLVTPS